MTVQKLCAELDLVHVVDPLKQLPQTEGNWTGSRGWSYEANASAVANALILKELLG